MEYHSINYYVAAAALL